MTIWIGTLWDLLDDCWALRILLDSTCLRLGSQWSGGSRVLAGQRVVDEALGSQWILGFSWAWGGRLGFGILAGLWAGSDYRVGWALGLPEDFGLVFGFFGCLVSLMVVWFGGIFSVFLEFLMEWSGFFFFGFCIWDTWGCLVVAGRLALSGRGGSLGSV